MSGRIKRRGEIADFCPAGRNARRAGRFFVIGGEIGGFFAHCAMGKFGFDFVAQLEETAGAYKNLENPENMYKTKYKIYKTLTPTCWICPGPAPILPGCYALLEITC